MCFLLRDLDEKADVYIALSNPNDELWNGNRDIFIALNELRIFGAKQPLSLLLSAYANLNIDDFVKILKICSVIYFRYNVISRLNPNDQEGVFNKIAIQISENKTFNKTDFSKIYTNDKIFKNNFSMKELKDSSRNRKIIKYILISIENNIAGTNYELISDKNTVEHILPQNPSEEWDLDDAVIDRLIYRLGNMCLLEKGKNNDLGNDTFESKKSVLLNSGFNSTKNIADNYDTWSEDSVASRQSEMAKKALRIWKIQF